MCQIRLGQICSNLFHEFNKQPEPALPWIWCGHGVDMLWTCSLHFDPAFVLQLASRSFSMAFMFYVSHLSVQPLSLG